MRSERDERDALRMSNDECSIVGALWGIVGDWRLSLSEEQRDRHTACGGASPLKSEVFGISNSELKTYNSKLRLAHVPLVSLTG